MKSTHQYDLVQHGTGFVGRSFLLALKKCAPMSKVAGVDISPQVIEVLRRNGIDGYLPDDVEKYDGAKFHSFSICTPLAPHPGDQRGSERHDGYDLSYLRGALAHFAEHVLKKTSDHKVVIIRSTVTPTTTEDELIPLLEKVSGKKAGVDFSVVFNPEFLQQAHARRDAAHPILWAYAATDDFGAKAFEKFFSSFGAPFFRFPDMVLVESLKIFTNSFNAVVISFFNECLIELHSLGCTDDEIGKAFMVMSRVALAKRSRSYGTAIAGPFGGACLPKDTSALLWEAPTIFHRLPLMVQAAVEVNKEMAKRQHMHAH